MWIPRNELALYALAVIGSALIFRWTLAEIIRAVADRKVPKCRYCEACGARVWFRQPLRLPTKADIYAFGGQVVEAMARAKGMPVASSPPAPASPVEGQPLIELDLEEVVEILEEQR